MNAGSSLAARLEGLIHEPTQVRADAVDLTVDEVYEVADAGRVDFGGGELAEATFVAVDTRRRSPDDDYGWWALDAGQYLLAYNERLTGDDRVRLQVRHELRERGASHPTLRTSELGHVPLSVGGDGVHIKENARVSTLTPP